MSNGKVHAPGELRSRAVIPPRAAHIQEALEELVAGRLQAVALGDATRRWFLGRSTAHGLATSIISGDISLDAFIKADRDMRANNSGQRDSSAELLGAWHLLKRGLAAVQSAAFGVSHDSGLERVSDSIDISAQAQRLESKDVRDWLQLVLSEWSRQLRCFRRGDGSAPSLERCVEAHSQHMLYSSFIAAARQSVKSTSTKSNGYEGHEQTTSKRAQRKADKAAAKAEREKPSGKDLGGKGKGGKGKGKDGKGGKGKDGRGNGKDASNDEKVWPDRPTLNPERWAEVHRVARAEWPDWCSHHMLGVCRRESCEYKHGKPPRFKEVVADPFKDG